MLVKKSGISLNDIGIVEINEAFASVAMAWQKEMEYPMDQININGGAIALGHPLGATGARLMTTMVHSNEKRWIFAMACKQCVRVAGRQMLLF